MNIKNILTCIISIAVIFASAEFCAYKIESNRLIKQGYNIDIKNPPYPKSIKTFSKYYFTDFNRDELIQKAAGKEYKKCPILVFGDVFVDSLTLPQNKNFTHKLSNYTKKPVYNLADAGWGVQHMYFLLNNEEKINDLNPDTIIFVFNNDLKNRLTSYSFYPHHTYLNLLYKNKNGELKERNPFIKPFYNSYFIRTIERFFGWRKSTSKKLFMQKRNYNMLKSLFLSSKDTAEKKYPQLNKFIILRDISEDETLEKMAYIKANNKLVNEEYNMWKELENNGFIIIDTPIINKDINKRNNRNCDESFNEEALDIIIPKFVEISGLTNTGNNTATMSNTNNIKNIIDKKTTVKVQSANKQIKSSQKEINKCNKELKEQANPWEQIRPEVLGNITETKPYTNKCKISEKKKINKKSFWNKLKFWNKFKRNKK